jgi:methyl-accepting chemotaxis protein
MRISGQGEFAWQWLLTLVAPLLPLALVVTGVLADPRAIAGAAAACALIAIVPAWLRVQRQNGRLAALATCLEAVAQGDCDLSPRLPLEGGAELLRVAGAFNALMERLQTSLRTVKDGVEHLAGSTGRVAAASSQVMEDSKSQHDASASTVAAVEQTTASINHVADHTRETAEISRHASSLSAQGEQVARETVQEMTRIAEAMKDSARLISSLSQRSKDISGIVKVIKDIAEQTNLLALNAAIEAARAGEQGRGFAVVADEVRKLAERTAGATTEISGMIEAIQSEVTSAVGNLGARNEQVGQVVKLAEQVAGALAEINAGAKKTQERIQEISVAATQQGAASSQIAGNIERIAKMAEQNNAAVAEAANSARYIDDLAIKLRDDFLRFKA